MSSRHERVCLGSEASFLIHLPGGNVAHLFVSTSMQLPVSCIIRITQAYAVRAFRIQHDGD